jgi:hypothetical protein
MGDLQLYGMTNLAFGGIPYFQAAQFELVINLDGQGAGN